MSNENNKFNLHGYEIEQRSDGMFNATDFLKQWNERTTGVKLRIDVFLRAADTKVFMEELKKDGVKLVDVVTNKQPVGRSTKTYWFDKYLFTSFIMWVDPKISIMFIRHYKERTVDCSPEGVFERTVVMLGVNKDNDKCEQIIKGLDYIVFGKHEPNMWLHAAEDQRKQLCDILSVNMYDVGLGVDYDGYLELLRNEYKQRHSKL